MPEIAPIFQPHVCVCQHRLPASCLCPTLSSWPQSQPTSLWSSYPITWPGIYVCSQLGKSSDSPLHTLRLIAGFQPSLLRASPSPTPTPTRLPPAPTRIRKGPVHPPKFLSWDEGLLGWTRRYKSRLRDVEGIGGGNSWIWELPDSSSVLPSRGKFRAGERNSWC